MSLKWLGGRSHCIPEGSLKRLPSLAHPHRSTQSIEDHCLPTGILSNASRSIHVKQYKSLDSNVLLPATQNNFFGSGINQSSSQFPQFLLKSSFNSKDCRRRSTLMRYLSKNGGQEAQKSLLSSKCFNELQEKTSLVDKKRKKLQQKLASTHQKSSEMRNKIQLLMLKNEALQAEVLGLKAKEVCRDSLAKKMPRIGRRSEQLTAELRENQTADRYFEIKLQNEAVFKEKMDGRLLELCRKCKQKSKNPVLVALLTEVATTERLVAGLGGNPLDWTQFDRHPLPR